jgi:hypothetical protein
MYILVALISFSSCKKLLDQQPTDSFSDENAFLTMDDVQRGTNAAYLRYGTYTRPDDGSRFDTYISDMYCSALTSDEARLGPDNSGQGALTYRYQYASDGTTGGDVTSSFYGYYALIDQVNRVLPKVATVTATAAEEPRRNILKGQLIALRGIAHFGLLQSFSKSYDPADTRGIPIMLQSNPLAYPARNTMGEVIGQIESDLAEAKTLLPAVAPADFKDTVMNRINIAAYQARIALYKRDYDAAIGFASEVINSGVKPLVSGPQYDAIWTDDTDNEVLFRIRFETSSIIGSLWATPGGTIYISPSSKLENSYSANDQRLAAFIGTNANGGKYVNKFFSSTRGGGVVDMKACRTAEMYLIRAEAYAKKASPDVTLGAADLNLLRSNRIAGYANQVFASATDLFNAVIEERFKELCFEGFRIYDLKRNNLPVQRLAADASAAWQTLPAGDYRFVFPIPNSEILANPQMAQNDGY